MSDIEFIDGLILKAKSANAPEFVVCKGSIKRKDLGNWLKAKTDEWINFDIKISKAGKLYAAVDNWQPSTEQREELKQAAQKEPDFNDDIPF